MADPRTFPLGILAATLAFSAHSRSPALPSTVPMEVAAAAPAGMHLLFFKASGPEADADADAVAVYETAPDKDNVTHRNLTIFRKRDGTFVSEVSNDKIIACSQCSQFHDDPFDGDYVNVKPGRIDIEQMDGGEMPSTTTLSFRRGSNGRWRVANATRVSLVEGRGKATTSKLHLPPSGFVSDLDGQWSVPVFFSAIAVNEQTHKFYFLGTNPSQAKLDQEISENCGDAACRVLVHRNDGCMSLVRDEDLRSFAAIGADPDDETVAVARAMADCRSSGRGKCTEIRTDCSTGIHASIRN